jgi:hypothetical protein
MTDSHYLVYLNAVQGWAVRCGLDCGLRFLVQNPVTY